MLPASRHDPDRQAATASRANPAYHAWAYDLDGQLRRTPHVGGPGIDSHESVNHCDLPLISVRAHVWMDVIFVNIGGEAPAFEDAAAP